MTEAREYLIVRNLQRALLAITVASGYHYGLTQAAVKIDPNTDLDQLLGDSALRPFAVVQVLPETWVVSGSRPSSADLTLPMSIHWVSQTTEATDEARLLTFYRGCADIERAIVSDRQRGGLAQDTIITGRTLERIDDGAQVWARIDIQIRTHRTYGVPDTTETG